VPLSDAAAQQDYDPVFSPDGAEVAFSREAVGMPTFGNVFTAASSGVNQGITPVTTNTTPNSFEVNGSWQPLNPPSCELGADAKQKSLKQVSLTVTCTNENVTVVAEGSGKAPKPKAGLALASKAKRFTIPPVTAEAPEGTPTTVTLAIPKKGKKALKKAAKAGKKGKATITATLTDDLGESSQDSFAVKFKAKKKK
jgi:hypothetical protein